MEAEAMCFLCVEAKSSRAASWVDQALRYMPGVGSMIAGVGAQRPGYCLISPTDHVMSICELPDAQLQAFEFFVASQLSALTIRYGSLTYWEHGGASAGRITSACVDHAHLNVLPGIVPLRIDAEGVVRYRDMSEWWSDAERWRGRPYVAYGHTNAACLVGPDPGVPQYFRRQVAHFVGQPDNWDYAACPNYALVKKTIDDMLELSL